jgi:glutathione S-transferase
VNRYVGETERLYGILDKRLSDRDWVAGPGRGKYSIADMSLVGWVNNASWAGLDLNSFPNVKAWFERVTARPATARGFTVPAPSQISNAALAAKLAGGDSEFVAKAEESKKFLADAKTKYNYKYSSP